MYRPMNSKVLIRLEKVETKTTSGIILAAASQKQKFTGEILAIGKNVEEIKVGDNVLIDRMSAKQEVEEGVIVIDSSDILLVIEDGNNR